MGEAGVVVGLVWVGGRGEGLVGGEGDGDGDGEGGG